MTKRKTLAKPQPKLKNIDYIAYLMLIPAILPIIYINIVSNEIMTFCGGIYVFICCILILLLICQHKTLLQNQDNTFLSKTALIIFFSITFLSFTYTVVAKYLAFRMNAEDVGIFMSMIRDVFYGKFGYASSYGFYHLERHQNYILFLLSIIYFIFFKSITAVLVCSAAALTAAGVFLYKITRLYFNPLIAIIITFTFFASPINSCISEFYPEIYYTLALALLFYVCVTDKSNLSIFLAVCFLLCIKEDGIFYIPGFLFILYQKKRFRLMAVVIVLSISVALFNTMVVEPYYFHKNLSIGINRPNIVSTYFPMWGTNYKEIVINVITHPIKFIQYCFNSTSGFWPNYMYWFFLPLLSPFALLSSGLIIILNGAVKENGLDMHAMTNYYSLGIGIIAFIGIILVFRQLILQKPKYKHVLQTLLIFIILTHNMLFINYSYLFNYISADQDQQQMSNTQFFMRLPLKFLWWRAFYKINIQDLQDKDDMVNYLIQNYHDKPICVDPEIYDNILTFDLPNIQPGDFYHTHIPITQNQCVIVFANDSSGFLGAALRPEDQNLLNTLMHENKCTNFGNFYACDNL